METWGLPLTPVHPHGCGEQLSEPMWHGTGGGSSPRVWGTELSNVARLDIHRFIPTGVGNRVAIMATGLVTPVHPHGCGEQSMVQRTAMEDGGSSPRVWGTENTRIRDEVKKRFIPTGVGNSATAAFQDVTGTVHPHGCGEQELIIPMLTFDAGSSPRVWGTAVAALPHRRTDRFIPTGVGNRYRYRRRRPRSPVHPHGCGEQSPATPKRKVLVGSSPRVWGTGLRDESAQGSSRFIPTGVGNSSSIPTPMPVWPVHPHGCGEQRRAGC